MELLREVRLARVSALVVGVVHAGWVRLARAVVVGHLLDDQLDQRVVLRVLLGGRVGSRRVRQLGAHDLIDRIRGQRPVGLVEDNQDVRVRQPALLELDDVQVRDHLAEDAVLVQLVEQHVKLQLEDARQQVGAIERRLAGEQRLRDLAPLRVARHRDEEGGLAALPDDRHACRVPSTERERGEARGWGLATDWQGVGGSAPSW